MAKKTAVKGNDANVSRQPCVTCSVEFDIAGMTNLPTSMSVLREDTERRNHRRSRNESATSENNASKNTSFASAKMKSWIVSSSNQQLTIKR